MKHAIHMNDTSQRCPFSNDIQDFNLSEQDRGSYSAELKNPQIHFFLPLPLRKKGPKMASSMALIKQKI